MARYLRLWVANQGSDGDFTGGYLRAAGADPDEFVGECIVLPATEENWQRFRKLREAVATIGHGDESDIDLMAGAEPPNEDPPDLVAYLVEVDEEDGWWEEPSSSAVLLQIEASRTAKNLAEFLRESLEEVGS